MYIVAGEAPALRTSITERFGRMPSSLCGRIGLLPHESIGDDERAVTIARVCAGTIDHSAEKPVTVERRDCSQLVMPGAANVVEILGK